MSIWVDAYIVEDQDGEYMEMFGDEVTAVQYVDVVNNTLRENSPPLIIRHTIVDIEG